MLVELYMEQDLTISSPYAAFTGAYCGRTFLRDAVYNAQQFKHCGVFTDRTV